MIETITSIDFQILDFIQAHLQCPFLDSVLPLFSALGNGGFLWLFIAAVLLCHKTHRRQGILILCGLFICFLLVNLALKPLVARPRPSWLIDFPLLIANPADFSFPSGHTVSAFITAFLLATSRSRLGYAVFPAAILMAFSRLYLYVHYPSDVLASVGIAALVSLFVLRVARKKV